MSTLKGYLAVAAILLGGFLSKGLLIGSQSVSFDSDEAVVALMGKHILAGERPVFFYGQTYMGSLDAFLTAGAFHLFGISVLTLRLVQLCLFMLLILSTYRLSRRLYEDEVQARISALLIALPPSLLSLYTTIALGGYVEILLFGVWVLSLGHQVTHEARESWPHWALLGFLGGAGFWTLPMIVVYLIPVSLVILAQRSGRRPMYWAVAGLGFILGSSPWWGYCLGHCEACLNPFSKPAAAALSGASLLQTIGYRVFGLVFLGLPALWGLRHPWAAQPVAPLPAIPVLALYLGSLFNLMRSRRRNHVMPLILVSAFLVVFLLTPYGNDASGRYLLPLYLPMSFFVADLISQVWRRRRSVAAAMLVLLLGFNAGTTVAGAFSEPAGMTGQLDARLMFGNQHDPELIAFLNQRGERHGYGNYWVAFKINFLSSEEITIAPRLPYKADLSYDLTDDRYPAYSLGVAASTTPPFFITSNQPRLDARLRKALFDRQINYRERLIGPYRVYYNLSARTSPQELGLYALE